MQRSLWHPLALVRVSSRLPAQELIDPALPPAPDPASPPAPDPAPPAATTAADALQRPDVKGLTSNTFGGRLQRLVRMRYKGLTLEQNVCAQLLLPSVRGATSTCLPSRGANRLLHCPRHRVAALIG